MIEGLALLALVFGGVFLFNLIALTVIQALQNGDFRWWR